MSRTPTLTCLALLCVAHSVTAQTAGTWRAVACMSIGRVGHVVVQLPDNRTLAAGGFSEPVSLASAEVFDPLTEIWSPIASMSTPRQYAAGVLLADGRVLVAGGYDQSAGTLHATAEVFNPTVGAWSPIASMNVPRGLGTATMLQEGRVLVVGGEVPGEAGFTATAEIYDPATDAWSPAASMSVQRGWHVSIRLLDGRVLVIGGDPGGSLGPASAEIYTPATNRWTPAGYLPGGIWQPSVALLPNGQVLVAGGGAGRPGTSEFARSQAHRYDAASNTWTRVPDMAVPRVAASALTLNDGRVLVSGGYPQDSQWASAEVYDLSTNTWSPTGPLAVPGFRYDHASVVRQDGTALIIGGCCEGVRPFSRKSAEIFTPGPPPLCPMDITSSLNVYQSSMIPFYATPFRFQWVLVRNPTGKVFAGPLSYVLTDLQNAAGVTALTTTCVSGAPAPYFRIDAGADGVLGPGEYRLSLLVFYQTGVNAISYTPRVLGGTPSR